MKRSRAPIFLMSLALVIALAWGLLELFLSYRAPSPKTPVVAKENELACQWPKESLFRLENFQYLSSDKNGIWVYDPSKFQLVRFDWSDVGLGKYHLKEVLRHSLLCSENPSPVCLPSASRGGPSEVRILPVGEDGGLIEASAGDVRKVFPFVYRLEGVRLGEPLSACGAVAPTENTSWLRRGPHWVWADGSSGRVGVLRFLPFQGASWRSAARETDEIWVFDKSASLTKGTCDSATESVRLAAGVFGESQLWIQADDPSGTSVRLYSIESGLVPISEKLTEEASSKVWTVDREEILFGDERQGRWTHLRQKELSVERRRFQTPARSESAETHYEKWTDQLWLGWKDGGILRPPSLILLGRDQARSIASGEAPLRPTKNLAWKIIKKTERSADVLAATERSIEAFRISCEGSLQKPE